MNKPVYCTLPYELMEVLERRALAADLEVEDIVSGILEQELIADLPGGVKGMRFDQWIENAPLSQPPQSLGFRKIKRTPPTV